MWKLFFLMCLVVMFVFVFSNTASASDIVLTEYGTNNPIFYYGTNEPVTISSEIGHPVQEFRGVWVTTVSNLDMPKYTSEQQYKQAYMDILNNMENFGVNAIIFQVRPLNDAFYQSDLNPWSRYLMGNEGVSPGWDPLSWMIEETHKKGMEFHAWFNPYRVAKSGMSYNNFASENPNLVVYSNDGDPILNPGEPKVKQFIIDTVMEVVENYDIDAVHFDDYFYPISGLKLDSDNFLYEQYKKPSQSLADWRRSNIDYVIQTLDNKLESYNSTYNKKVQLGISPFGIWASRLSVPGGANTSSRVLQTYSAQYADTRKWVKNNWLDYIVPQVYFDFNHPTAPYADIVKWWVETVRGTKVNLYIGQAIYNYGYNTDWSNPQEIPNQMRYDAKYDEIKGTVFFRYKFLVDDYYTSNSSLVEGRNIIKNQFWNSPALHPTYNNISAEQPRYAKNISIISQNDGHLLRWNNDDSVIKYLVYRYDEKGGDFDPGNASQIIAYIDATSVGSEISYLDDSNDGISKYRYFIVAMGEANYMSNPVYIDTSGTTYVLNTDDKSAPIIEVEKTKIDVNSKEPDWKTFVSIKDDSNKSVTLTYDASDVELKKGGTYTVIFNAMDWAGNTSSKAVAIEVIDNTKPIISLKGESEVTINVGKSYTDLGVNVKDNQESDIKIKTISNVNTSKVGTYSVIYEATDFSGNTSMAERIVNVVDLTPPKVVLMQGIDTIFAGDYWVDGEIFATDNYDDNLSISVDRSELNTEKAGRYKVIYTVSDSSGNKTTLMRCVTVLKEKPNIHLVIKPGIDTVNVGEKWTDAGCKYVLNNEENICSVTDNNIETSTPGMYQVKYSVNIDGYTYTLTRYVYVLENIDVNSIAWFDSKRRLFI